MAFDVVVFGCGSEKRSGSIDEKGGDDCTPISVRSNVMLTVHKVTADCEVSQAFMDVYGMIADVWGVHRTVGGSVSQNTREISESCGIRWILTVIEVLSRYAFAIPVWRKNTESKTKAVENVLAQFKERFGRYPKTAQFDDGKEFYNVEVKTLLKDHDVHYFFTRTFRKAALVERFNRTLKTRMWKYFTENRTKVWVDVLPNLVRSYNNTIHRTIGKRPSDVNEENKDEVWTRIYGYPLSSFPNSKFKIGDHVRVEIKHQTFEKGYEPNFDNEVYVVTAVFRGDPNMYSLKDPEDGEDILGRYYEQELSLDLNKNGHYRDGQP